MTKLARVFITITAAILLWAHAARAETITMGSLIGAGNSEPVGMSFAGESFQFFASASPWSGIWGPMTCMLDGCSAGMTLDLDARWSGMDLLGTAIVNGATYTNVGSLDRKSGVDAHWMSSMVIPSEFGGGLLSAPFLFEGLFWNGVAVTDLVGRGTVVAEFMSLPQGGLAMNSITYSFGETTPNPEPGTMLLLASGLAGLAYRRRLAARRV